MSRIYGSDTRKKLSLSLAQYITGFQDEVHTLKACAVENLDRSCAGRTICILLTVELLSVTISDQY
jgi:hypothetical protein